MEEIFEKKDLKKKYLGEDYLATKEWWLTYNVSDRNYAEISGVFSRYLFAIQIAILYPDIQVYEIIKSISVQENNDETKNLFDKFFNTRSNEAKHSLFFVGAGEAAQKSKNKNVKEAHDLVILLWRDLCENNKNLFDEDEKKFKDHIQKMVKNDKDGRKHKRQTWIKLFSSMNLSTQQRLGQLEILCLMFSQPALNKKEIREELKTAIMELPHNVLREYGTTTIQQHLKTTKDNELIERFEVSSKNIEAAAIKNASIERADFFVGYWQSFVSWNGEDKKDLKNYSGPIANHINSKLMLSQRTYSRQNIALKLFEIEKKIKELNKTKKAIVNYDPEETLGTLNRFNDRFDEQNEEIFKAIYEVYSDMNKTRKNNRSTLYKIAVAWNGEAPENPFGFASAWYMEVLVKIRNNMESLERKDGMSNQESAWFINLLSDLSKENWRKNREYLVTEFMLLEDSDVEKYKELNSLMAMRKKMIFEIRKDTTAQDYKTMIKIMKDVENYRNPLVCWRIDSKWKEKISENLEKLWMGQGSQISDNDIIRYAKVCKKITEEAEKEEKKIRWELEEQLKKVEDMLSSPPQTDSTNKAYQTSTIHNFWKIRKEQAEKDALIDQIVLQRVEQRKVAAMASVFFQWYMKGFFNKSNDDLSAKFKMTLRKLEAYFTISVINMVTDEMTSLMKQKIFCFLSE